MVAEAAATAATEQAGRLSRVWRGLEARWARHARLGAMLQVMLARTPHLPPPEIRAWLPHDFTPPQVTRVQTQATAGTLMVRPLKDRTNLVITRNANYDAPGAIVVGSLENAIEKALEK